MRNIAEYPVDAEEAASVLITEAAGFPHELIGDMRPYVCQLAAGFILKNKDAFDAYAKGDNDAKEN